MTDFRDEDPARTGDLDYFDGFMEKLAGRDADDRDFFEKPSKSEELPPMEQWEIDEAKAEIEARKKETAYFMKCQIDKFCKSSAQRDMMYKKHGIKGE